MHIVPKRLVAYARVSTKLQESNTSIPNQIERMHKYCDSMQHELVGEPFTDVLSGSKLERQGLQAALQAVLVDNKADGLICCYLDRLSRNTKDFLEIVERFEKAGKALIFLDVQMDTTHSTGRMVLTVLMAMAQMQREQTKEKSKAGRQYLRDQGKIYLGQAPYGWTPATAEDGTTINKLVPVASEQAVLKQIYRLADQGSGSESIAQELNRLNKPTRHDGTWHRKQIQRILERRDNLIAV